LPDQDEVRLTVPATPEFLRLARVTAAGMASRLGFTYDEVEDLRLAIDELCFVLVGPHGRSGTVQLRYVATDGVLEIEGIAESEEMDGVLALSDLSRQILVALVEDHDVGPDPEKGRPSFRLRKRHDGTGG